jgi:hypothetical protein
MRFPIGPAYLGIIFLLANTASGLPASWSGNDYIRTIFNGKQGTQATMTRIAAVQDARQIGRPDVITSLTEIYTANSISFPANGVIRELADLAAAPARKAAFFLNFGQETAASVLSRRFLSLNTSAPGFATFDVEIQLGAYTSPQITVLAIIDDAPEKEQSTEVISMIREKTWDLQSSGEKVFTDLPPYTYRSLYFDGLDGIDEGFAISLDNLEIVNTIDVGIAKNRSISALAINSIFGVKGFQLIDEATGVIAGNQGVIFDAGGNADNTKTVTTQTNVQLRFSVAASTSITGVLEIVGNPLTT